MTGLSDFVFNILILNFVCLDIFHNSLVLGLYLANQTGNETGSKKEKQSIGVDPVYLWPSYEVNGVRRVDIPYVSDLDTELQTLFQNVANQFEKNSCVHWVPRTNQQQFVRVISTVPSHRYDPTRCLADVGHGPFDTFLYVSRQCLSLPPYPGPPRLSALAHEMFHTLNFIHEHQRRDRDCYIYISDNALQNDPRSYEIYTLQQTDLSFPYDEESIMQYHSYGSQMQSKYNKVLGPKGDLPTFMDWVKLNMYYCGGPHYCDLSSDTRQHCEQHQRIQEQCFRQG